MSEEPAASLLMRSLGSHVQHVTHRESKALDNVDEPIEPLAMAKAMSPAMLQVLSIALSSPA